MTLCSNFEGHKSTRMPIRSYTWVTNLPPQGYLKRSPRLHNSQQRHVLGGAQMTSPMMHLCLEDD